MLKFVFTPTYNHYAPGLSWNRFDHPAQYGKPAHKGWHISYIVPVFHRRYVIQIRSDKYQ